MPFETGNQIRSFRSIDGGASWRSTVAVATVQHHTEAGNLRSGSLPTAEIDSAGIGIDRNTSGTTARIGVTYYFYPVSNCTAATCQLSVGFISSTNGGTSWSTATQVAGPMTLASIPNTSQGRMFGDYISTSVRPGGNAFPVIPIASAPSGTTFNMGMFVPTNGLAI